MVASDIDSEDGMVTRLMSMTTSTITVIDVNDNCAAVFLDSHQPLTLNRKIYVFLVQLQCSDRDEEEMLYIFLMAVCLLSQ